MRAPITDKHLLGMMWKRFPEIMKRGAEQPAQCSPAEDGVCEALDCSNHKPAQQEPVQEQVKIEHCLWARNGNTPCPHTSPPAKRPWAGLTDEEISEIAINSPPMVHEFARAIEAKLKEKNT